MNQTELMNFTYQDRAVRTVMIDGQPWWVLKDVCDVLNIANARDLASRLDDDEKETLESAAESAVAFSDGASIPHNATIVNEPGLYSVILRSNKPEAKAFKRWITHDVLPQIRKTGGYGAELDLSFPEVVTSDSLQRLVDNMRILEQQRDAAKARLAIAEPKAERYDEVIESPGLMDTTAIAKDLGFRKASDLHKRLDELGIIYRDRDGMWNLRAAYSEAGYAKHIPVRDAYGNLVFTKTGKVLMQLAWTYKGRQFIFDLLGTETDE